MNPGPYVKLSVVDNGTGMSPKTRVHIFEPYFTTKERGKGTGLGLATVYGIVKQSGGFIWLTSDLGCGTTFDIYFPPVNESPTRASNAPVPTGTFAAFETILLVEDEADLRTAIGEFLQSKGYRVLVAADGMQAKRICEQHSSAIDVILADLVMPGMDGIEVVKAVISLFPDIHVLYMSGYTGRAVELLDSGAVLLKKPFGLPTSENMLRVLIDARKPVGRESI
jgi:CheY-like chemotaxis protein